MNYVNVEGIKAEYGFYSKCEAFTWGYNDYMNGRRARTLPSVAGQAYDRGYEAGMRVRKAADWCDDNVGAN